MFILPKTACDVVMIYFHGNGEDIGCCIETCSRLADALNAVVFVPEYPGYGASRGTPSSESIDAIARAVTTSICSQIQVPPSRIIIMGRSIGTGAAGSGEGSELIGGSGFFELSAATSGKYNSGDSYDLEKHRTGKWKIASIVFSECPNFRTAKMKLAIKNS